MSNLWYNNRGDGMKERKRFKYKSIFKYPEHQESLEYEGIGIIECSEVDRIVFKSKDIVFNLTISSSEAILKNNGNTIFLKKDQITMNDYQTPYGVCTIQCKLKSIIKLNGYKIVYDIMDGSDVVSTVYIMISIHAVEEQYEA